MNAGGPCHFCCCKTINVCAPPAAPLLPHGGCSPQTEESWKEALQPAQEEPALLHHPWDCAHPAHWSPPREGESQSQMLIYKCAHPPGHTGVANTAFSNILTALYQKIKKKLLFVNHLPFSIDTSIYLVE